MSKRSAYLLLLVPALLWCAGFLVLPLTGRWGDALAGDLYGRVCHQLDDRSFAWFGATWAVCVRCSSIYLSFAATIIVVAAVRGLDRWTPLSSRAFAFWLAPAVLDAALSFSGLHPADTTTRIVTGALAGIGLGVTIPPLFIDALTRSRKHFHAGEHDVR